MKILASLKLESTVETKCVSQCNFLKKNCLEMVDEKITLTTVMNSKLLSGKLKMSPNALGQKTILWSMKQENVDCTPDTSVLTVQL